MQLAERILSMGRQAWCRLAASLVAIVAVMQVGLALLPDWRRIMVGWEAYSIAQALVAGKGYSFPSRIGFPDGGTPFGNSEFHPTAWVDPFYTFSLAGLIRLFGSYHQLAAAVLNLVLLLLVFGFTYRLCERLISPPAGVAAVLALPFSRAFYWDARLMNNTLLAMTFVLLAALMLVTFLEAPSSRRAAALGLVLGLMVLACPGAQLFIPITAVAVAALGWKHRGPTVSQAIIMCLVAALTLLPWSIRNYVVFGEWVPVRTGLGQISFVGVVAAAGTVVPERLPAHLTPPWRAETLRSAVKQTVDPRWSGKQTRALEGWLTDYSNAVGPRGYSALNEAQRDAWFLQQTKEFVLANPVVSAQLALAKLEVFVRIMGIFGVLVCLLAAIGGTLATQTPAVLTLAVWVGSFVGPFLLVICYWPRYRAPIQPILVVLAVFAIWRLGAIGGRRLGSTGPGRTLLRWYRA